MISKNGTTWTEPQETEEYFAKLKERYGGDVGMPVCVHCGAKTCYVVEEADEGKRFDPDTQREYRTSKPRRPFVAILGRALSAFQHEGMLFLAMKVCTACDARQDGRACATLKDKEAQTSRALKLLTPDEFQVWQKAFNEGWYARLKKIDEINARRARKDASRYNPSKTKEQLI